MHTPLAWTQNQWQPLERTRIALDDVGFLQGAVIVDRLRTYGGIPLDVALHVNRLMENCNRLSIRLPRELDLSAIIGDCAEKNRAAFGGADFSIVSLVTPGRATSDAEQPTVIVHPAAIPWNKLKRWYTRGQPLVVADARNVPAMCWSPAIKTRSRLHYYLAELQAAASNLPDAGAILLDANDNLTETSNANLMIVEQDDRLVLPPLHTVLSGISLQRTMRLAKQLGLDVRAEPISLKRASSAKEILLCGSVGCLWPASHLGNVVYPGACTGSVYSQLSIQWIDELDLDYVAQATTYATTDSRLH